MDKKYYLEIDLAKGFAIVLAVFGHAAPDAVKDFWIVGQNSISASMHHLVYSFHMALFFACSGFLLYPKLGKAGGVNVEALKRFKRLMIPYFFLSFLYLAGKMFGGGLADHQLTDNPIVGILGGCSPCYGAWFLWCLFVMSMVVLCLKKVNLWVLFGLGGLISYIPLNIGNSFIGLRNVQVYIMWVVFGCMIHKYYARISKRINIWLGLFETHNHIVSHSIGIIKTISGIIASYTLCYMIAVKTINSFVNKALKICGDYCMDIYILSMFVLVPLRILYVNIGVMNYIPYYLWLIIATILGVILPICVSKYYVRRTKLLKILLLGG